MTEGALERIASLHAEDARLRFERFDHEDAAAVGSRIIADARERSLAVTVSVWLGEQLVFHAARPGTSADNDRWLERKAAVVRRYDSASMLMRERVAAIGSSAAYPALGLDPARFALAGGAVPIRIGATQVGVAAVSGLTDEEDHAMVVQALERHR